MVPNPRIEPNLVLACCTQSESYLKPSLTMGHHFVLVHGLGHGAWCWYKVTALLQAAGHTVTPLDLTSNGNSKVVADTVTSVAHYLQPLTHFLANRTVASSDDKVILVGHSLGGSCISYAMELYPEKVCKAVFVAALMPSHGSSTFLPPEYLTKLIAVQALVKNPPDSPPTTIRISPTHAHEYFYNNSPAEDVSLACASLNPTPFVVTLETLALSKDRYGSIPRFYITAPEDRAIPALAQASIIQQNPPQQVFTIEQSDHSPFFCQPAALVNVLVSIAAT